MVKSTFEMFRSRGGRGPAVTSAGAASASGGATRGTVAGGYERLRGNVSRTNVDATNYVHELVAAADKRKVQAAALQWDYEYHLSLGVRVAFRVPHTARPQMSFGTVLMHAAESAADALDDLFAVRLDGGADVLLGAIELSEALDLYDKVQEKDGRPPPPLHGGDVEGEGEDPALEAYLRSEHLHVSSSSRRSSSSSSSSSSSAANEDADEGAGDEDIQWTGSTSLKPSLIPAYVYTMPQPHSIPSLRTGTCAQ